LGLREESHCDIPNFLFPREESSVSSWKVQLFERHLLKIMRGLAEYLEQTTINVIDDLKKVYGLTLTAADSHQLTESTQPGT
ncbi:MAG TPA: hypothetical protein VG246_07130, partial [Acidimicrobiales bacterium]|nr:hypothetical protein [Acidimicrobiales bacterium]